MILAGGRAEMNQMPGKHLKLPEKPFKMAKISRFIPL